MTTPSLMTDRRLSFSMPIGNGFRKVIEVPSAAIDSTLIFANERPLPGAASYQRVADNLLREDFWGSHRVFVTSPTAGDGKTCTAFNLAWALSTRGSSVLLVELNFAHPQFRGILGDLRIRYGIDCALRGSAHPDDSVFSMGSGGPSVSAVRNATSRRALKQHLPNLAAYLEWASEQYDWLILDCPPVLSRAWNWWFREHAEAALLVVREQHTAESQIRKASKRLGANLKGVLMNDTTEVDSTGHALQVSSESRPTIASVEAVG